MDGVVLKSNPNKANSLGLSKASLRSVLPAGDLQRYVENTK